MAFLIQRNGTYYIAHSVSGKQKRLSLKTTDGRIAKTLLKDWMAKQDEPVIEAYPVASVVQAYVEHLHLHGRPGRVGKDLSLYRDAFGECCPGLKFGPGPSSQHAKARRDLSIAKGDPRYATLPITDLTQLTTPVVIDWLNGIYRSRQLSPRAGNRYRQVLSTLCTFAMKQRNVPLKANPIAAVPRFKEARPDIVFMSLAQIDQQLEALTAYPKYQAIVAVLIFAGLRRSEVLWLQVKDVDLGRGRIHVRAKNVKGKTWASKTGRDRIVPINQSLQKYLEAYTSPADPEGWFFPSSSGLRIDKDKFTHYLSKLNYLNRIEVGEYRRAAHFARKAGRPLPTEVRSKKLPWNAKIFRHTYASQLAARGASLFQIAKLMGNSNDVCERYYADLVTAQTQDVIEFGKGPAPVKVQAPEF